MTQQFPKMIWEIISPSLFIWSHCTVDTSFPYHNLVKTFKYQICLSKTEKHTLFAVGCAAFGLLLALLFPPRNASVKPKPNPKPLAEQWLLSITPPLRLRPFNFHFLFKPIYSMWLLLSTPLPPCPPHHCQLGLVSPQGLLPPSPRSVTMPPCQ